MRRIRMVVVLAGFAVWALIIVGRLVWLQAIQHSSWQERADRQQERTFAVAPRRGILYDRNLHELAMTVTVDSVYAVPEEMPSEAIKEQDAEALAAIVHRDPEDRFTEQKEILARMNASRAFAWVARKQPPAVIAQVKALHLKGIYFQKEFKRFYPDQNLAAQVLGYVGMDDDGLAGVEEVFDKQLHGTAGRMLTAVDARRHVLASQERDPKAGENLVLTIDSNIQFMAEQALAWNMERTGAEHGTVVVQDPHTGQILALAVQPSFNPNDFKYTSPALLDDRAVTDVYEPGSVFKIVTYSAAIDSGVATPDGTVDCEGGAIDIAGRIVHDAPGEHFHVITVAKALAESSDVGAIQMALRMGKDTFYKYIRAFGFGQKTGIMLPGETRGLLKPPNRWQPTTIGSIPMGQEVAVTPIQVATMVSTVANGGMYLPPHVVMDLTPDAGGHLEPAAFHPEYELPNPLPAGAHRVISELSAAQMRQMLEGVVLNGTGRSAQLNGYSAGGKTGTAQKIDPKTHTYSKTNYIASFVGFAPVNNPAVVVVVVMDSPHKGGPAGHYGAQASAPLFQKLAQQILEYLGVPHDEPVRPTKLVAANNAAAARMAAQDVDPPQNLDDLESLFAEANHLPADDPLSGEHSDQSAELNQQRSAVSDQRSGAVEQGSGVKDQGSAVSDQRSEISGQLPVASSQRPASSEQLAAVSPPSLSSTPASAPGSVAVASHQVAVPSFAGKSMRQAVMDASAAGLGLRVVGSGVARQQAPPAGTMVPAGTEVVVQFQR
jgi:cell division protein FtsI (penicillin-binding protein 3)